ncbi:MAG: efflux RND transporter periplasmic adaptor subunit [Burkholderiales bacterium]|nr:efflux RND transporter periplasmic adaptor subunit [Burkholderiales bacterium]
MNFAQRLTVTLVVAALAGCGRQESHYEEVRPVRTTVVQDAVATGVADYAGDVRARREAPLGFRIGGQITARYVELGEHVAAGQPLFRLDGRDVELQTAAAKSQLDKARMDFERARQLKDKGFVSQSNVDQAKAAFDVAESQFKLAANQDGYAVLKAEHAGVVTSLNGEAGQVVAAGQPVAAIAEDGEREVAISIPESRVNELRKADKIAITLWASPGKRYTGKLRDLAVDTDPATRTYAARITITDADDAVRLGMTANVLLPSTEQHGIALPLTAIYDIDGRQRVWLVDKATNRVHAQEVHLGEIHDNAAWIADGIKPGDVVVTAGAHLLHTNELVRLAESQLARP